MLCRNPLADKYYTYLWLREDGTPYYAGKGSENRAYDSHQRIGKAPTRSLVIIQFFSSEEDAFIAERLLIALYGREDLGTGCLSNLTDGGENPPLCKSHPDMWRQNMSARKRIDLTSQRFSRLTVIEFATEESLKRRRPCWLCLCRCGTPTFVNAGHLRSGRIRSCGCLKKEMVAARNKTLPNLGKKYKRGTGIERPPVVSGDRPCRYGSRLASPPDLDPA